MNTGKEIVERAMYFAFIILDTLAFYENNK